MTYPPAQGPDDPFAKPGQPPQGPPPQYGQPPQGPPPQGPPPQYGQPQYGQPPQGPPPQYGQPQYGQPQYGQPMPPPAPGYGYGTQQGTHQGGPGALAGMGARFGGLLIDYIIIAIPIAILSAIFGGFESTSTYDVDGNVTKSVHITSGSVAVDILGLIIALGYSAYFIGMQTQSIGHKVVGIRVVDATTGGPIGPGRGALRWFVMAITGAICTLGYWSPFFDSQRRQGWHDKAASSIAISAK